MYNNNNFESFWLAVFSGYNYFHYFQLAPFCNQFWDSDILNDYQGNTL